MIKEMQVSGGHCLLPCSPSRASYCQQTLCLIPAPLCTPLTSRLGESGLVSRDPARPSFCSCRDPKEGRHDDDQTLAKATTKSEF